MKFLLDPSLRLLNRQFHGMSTPLHPHDEKWGKMYAWRSLDCISIWEFKTFSNLGCEIVGI